jgi:hypothetical protein
VAPVAAAARTPVSANGTEQAILGVSWLRLPSWYEKQAPVRSRNTLMRLLVGGFAVMFREYTTSRNLAWKKVLYTTKLAGAAKW